MIIRLVRTVNKFNLIYLIEHIINIIIFLYHIELMRID